MAIATGAQEAVDAAAKALGTDVVDGIDPGPQEPFEGDDSAYGEDAGIDEVPRSDDEVVGLTSGGAQLTFNVGGKKPTSTSLTLTGGKIDIGGSYAKGSKLVLRVEVRVGEVSFIDEVDSKTHQVIGCRRGHKARILNVQVG